MIASTLPQQLSPILEQQRQFFATGQTRSLAFRQQQLQALLQALNRYEEQLLQALHADLRKPTLEAFTTDIAPVRSEIQAILKQLPRWLKPQRRPIAKTQFPAQAWIEPEPLGVVLIIGAWNYPVYLVLLPLLGAIAAGNCAILKPSEYAPHTNAVLRDLIKTAFDPAYITLVEGAAETSQALLQERFDHIFFTGSSSIGRLVMQAAAQHLTPVTLELGGKSPCIVEPDVDLAATARRILWGKFLNAGQTCIAPDYLLVNRQIKAALIEQLRQTLTEYYGSDPSQSPNYARIISDRHFDRLVALIPPERVLAGGSHNRADRYLAPTLLDNITWADSVMQDEIFGPILPILDYDDLGEAIAAIAARPKPLALYCFSNDRQIQARVLQETSSGGICFNDTLMHVVSHELPFGGVGNSGLGAYHGKASFDTFTHYKSVLRRHFWLDFKFRYPPYPQDLSLFKKLL